MNKTAKLSDPIVSGKYYFGIIGINFSCIVKKKLVYFQKIIMSLFLKNEMAVMDCI